MINEEYFHRLYDRKDMSVNNERWVEPYRIWSICYNEWYDRYRNDIYNGNKIMNKRPSDRDLFLTNYICRRVENDITNYIDWRNRRV
jgi:hypothetical protein